MTHNLTLQQESVRHFLPAGFQQNMSHFYFYEQNGTNADRQKNLDWFLSYGNHFKAVTGVIGSHLICTDYDVSLNSRNSEQHHRGKFSKYECKHCKCENKYESVYQQIKANYYYFFYTEFKKNTQDFFFFFNSPGSQSWLRPLGPLTGEASPLLSLELPHARTHVHTPANRRPHQSERTLAGRHTESLHRQEVGERVWNVCVFFLFFSHCDWVSY